ncbi:MAG TPA: sugar ABC transporter ATP-binding protein [Pyrinomonadaceae bacterium]|nr:sugar ABC transporter ATP-binding protein [Pyrinomonadaceae bacterium]
MSNPILEMRGIGKRFPGVVALEGVSLEVRPGEVVALIGENGAGKSTLMKILGGVYQPDAGEVLIEGKPAHINSVPDAIALGIGFIHQELNVLENLDAAGNIFLGREPRRGRIFSRLDRKKMHADARVYLERLGLNVAPDTPLSRLSIAQQQLVEIAKALSQRARLLIMDEPTSSLTLAETERLMSVVKELRAQGVSIIYISHRLGEVMELADRVVALRDGRNAGQLSRQEITHERMVRMMVGRDIKSFYAHERGGEGRSLFGVRDLRTRRYPQHSVTFDIREGEILGLAGLVGAGRTELAQAVFGAEPPVGGTLTLGGEEVRVRSPRDAIRHGIYLVPEDRRRSGLNVEELIRKNVTLPSLHRYASAGVVRAGEERKVSQRVCDELGVKAPSVEVRAGNLSGGNQQKVVLAKWLSLEPKLLIFDEPTRGIDVGAKAEIYELMRRLAARGVAVLMISSDMEEVLGVSDRVAVMHEGRLTGILGRRDCTEENVMRLAVGHTGGSESPSSFPGTHGQTL